MFHGSIVSPDTGAALTPAQCRKITLNIVYEKEFEHELVPVPHYTDVDVPLDCLKGSACEGDCYVLAGKTPEGTVAFRGTLEAGEHYLSENSGFNRIVLVPLAGSGTTTPELPPAEQSDVPRGVLLFAGEDDGDLLNVFWSGGVNLRGPGETPFGSGLEFEVPGPILAGTHRNAAIPKTWL